MADPRPRRLTQDEINHQRRIESQRAEVEAEQTRARAEAEREAAKAQREKAAAEAAALRARMEAEKVEAEARAAAIRAQNDPALLARKAEEERIAAAQRAKIEQEKRAAEIKQADHERTIRLGLSVTSLVGGMTAGHLFAHVIEKRSNKTNLARMDALNELAKKTEAVLKKGDARMEKALAPTPIKAIDPKTKQPMMKNGVPVVVKPKPTSVPGELLKGDKRKLAGLVRAYDTANFAKSFRGPLGLGIAATLLAEGAISRFYFAKQAKQDGNQIAADIFDTVGTTSIVAATSLIGTRGYQIATKAKTLPVPAHATMEIAREAAGLAPKPVVPPPATSVAAPQRGLLAGLKKVGAVGLGSRVGMVVGGALLVGAAYQALRTTGEAVARNGPVEDGRKPKLADAGGVVQVREHVRLTDDGKVQTVKAHTRQVG